VRVSSMVGEASSKNALLHHCYVGWMYCLISELDVTTVPSYRLFLVDALPLLIGRHTADVRDVVFAGRV